MRARTSFLALALGFVVAATSRGQEPIQWINISPSPDSTVTELTFINVIFNESVLGVEASDLLINGTPASAVVTNNPNDYAFYFPEPPAGAVQVAWAANHSITNDLGRSFAGGDWTYTLDPNAVPPPRLILSEFMAANEHGIEDEDGTRSDWIEVYNAGLIEADLSGWFLTDDRLVPTRWRFPDGLPLLAPNEYLLVWASAKDRTNALAPLHANFRLARDGGGYLALLDPATNIVSVFNSYPLQEPDVSYGRDPVDPDLTGYFATPTPGAQNSGSGAGFAPEPVFSLPSGLYTNAMLTVTITAGSGTIRYTRDGTLPTSASPLYVGPIAISNNVTLKARVFASGTNLLPSAVVARNFIFLDNTTRNFTSEIPIVIISTEGRGMAQNVPPGQARTKGSLVVIDTFRGRSSLQSKPDYLGPAEFEIFGQTSAGFPKKPYRIEIQDELFNDRKVSLLGMPAEADWRLRNPYSDRFLMGDFLAFELFEQMGHYQLRRRMVEVFADTGGGRLSYPADYVGVEMLAEGMEVGKDRVNLSELTPSQTNEPAISGGYMFKKDKDSTGDLNFSTAGGGGFGGQTLKLHEPKPRAVNNSLNHPQMLWLRNYLNRFEASLYAPDWLTRTGTNHYSHYLDVDSFVDQHWIVEFPKQIDGYRLSNYFSKDRNGRLKDEPIWDWNLAWGNADYLDGGHTNGWYYTQTSAGDHIWLRRLITGNTGSSGVGDADFCQRIADRWGQLRTNVMNGPRLLARIDEIAALLSEAAVRNYQKYPSLVDGTTYQWPNPNGGSWHVDYVHVTNYSMIISNLKHWVEGRYHWVDSQFTRPPAMNHPGGLVNSGFTLTLTGPSGAAIYYTLDGSDPRGRFGVTNGLRYTGPIPITGNARVVARARTAGAWQNTWSGPTAATLYTSLPPLRITELMYRPPAGSPGDTNDADNFEFIEVRNTGAAPLNLNRFRIRDGVNFEFPSVSLAAGQYAVVVANLAAFQSRYGANNPDILVVGAYTNHLDNGGERLVLEGPMGEPLLDFVYDDGWYPITDGLGFSLVVVDDTAAPGAWNLPGNWRPSGVLRGTPGQPDPGPAAIAPIVVNEAMSHTVPLPGDTVGGDWIELFNPTAGAVDLGDWYLTDAFNTPKKYRFPANTIIPAGGYALLYQSNSFGLGPGGFGLSSAGDQVYLFSGNAAGELTGYVDGFDFGAQSLGATFGRHVISTGEDQFPTQIAPTPGATNAGPRVGPIVITEIQYHPFDVVNPSGAWDNTEDEFIELRNISSQPVPLYDPAHETNTWKLRDAVDFSFPPGVVVPAGGYVVVVSFDPGDPTALNAFRNRYPIPDGTLLFGPYTGKLDNSSDNVELASPEPPETPPAPTAGLVPYVLMDQARYTDVLPWPVGADGIGASLQRVDPAAYGNDPANWIAAGPGPGAPYIPGPVPVVLAQPSDATGFLGYPVTFSVVATGTEPLTYQWRHDGTPIYGAYAPVFTIPSVQNSDAGGYDVVIMNSGGAISSSNAVLTVLVPPTIDAQPQTVYLAGSTNELDFGNTTNGTASFSVSAHATYPLTYQWRRNGVPIPGATQTAITITNVDLSVVGVYDVVVTDGINPVVSDPAHLGILQMPVIVQGPLNQVVPVGGTFSVSVQLRGGPPPFMYQWRRGSSIVTTEISDSTNSVFTYGPVSQSDQTTWRVAVTNPASPVLTRITQTFTVTVQADFDGDGLPDPWEVANGFSTNDASNASLDTDGDGMTLWQEYIAGTDWNDPGSYLRINSSSLTHAAGLSFVAVSNRTYTVEFNDQPGAPSWHRLADVVAAPSNRVETVVDPAFATNRVYRLVTPRQP